MKWPVPLICLIALASAGCATADRPRDPRDAFFGRLSGLCGLAFKGRIASPPVESDSAFAGKALVMHVRDCSKDVIRIPFHVGDDRSRTWVVTRTSAGLRLKHDHRHSDGSEDALTQYGGDTVGSGSLGGPGTPARQAFPADDFSKAMFVRLNSAQSVPNVWAMEVEPGSVFAYELRRPGRYFRVEFDLRHPVAPPPPPWGAAHPR